MKELLLHIGTFKTGSTALQRFLLDNAGRLDEQGLGVFAPEGRYPESYKHRLVPKCITAAFLFPDFARVSDGESLGYTAEQCELIRCSREKDLGAFKRFVDDHDRIVLSSEGLYRRPLEFWAYLKDLLTSLGIDRTRILIYLRRQDELASSWYRQCIRSNDDLGWLDTLYTERQPLFDYDSDLMLVEEFFGRENIALRRYAKGRLYGDDIRKDFCEALGLAWSDDFILDSRRNASISFDMAEVKRVVNTSPSYADSDNFFGPLTERLAQISADGEPPSFFAPEEARAFMSLYEEGNASLADRYFDGEALFDGADSDAMPWTRDTDKVLDASILMMAEALTLQQARIEKLEARLNAPSSSLLSKIKELIKR